MSYKTAKNERPFFDWLKVHPAMGGTFFIIFSAAIGMIYEVKLYSAFDINIFVYSDIEDFFLSWLRDPIASIFVAVSFFGLIGNYIGRLYNDHVSKDSSIDTSFVDMLLIINFVIFPILTVIAIFIIFYMEDSEIITSLGLQEFILSILFIIMIFGLGVFSGYKVKLNAHEKWTQRLLIVVAGLCWIFLTGLVIGKIELSILILFGIAAIIELLKFVIYYKSENYKKKEIDWPLVEELISNRLPIILAIFVIVGPFIAAQSHCKEIKSDRKVGYYVSLRLGNKGIITNCEPWQIIGKSASYTFFYDKENDTPKIVRSNGILKISEKKETCGVME